MWQRFKRWWRSGWSRWWVYPFAIAITGLTFYLFTDWGAAQYVPVGLGLLFAVVVSAYVGGFWPGLLSTLIVAALLKVFIFGGDSISIRGIPIGTPSLHLWFPIVFAFMGAIVSVLFEALHRSRRTSDAARRELAATLANISDAIITTDTLGRIEYLNQAAVLLLQRNSPEAVGQPFEAVVKIRDAADADRPMPLVDRVRDTAHTVHISSPQVLLRDDGKVIAVEATAAPVRDTEGELASVVVTLRDCSGQREVENALRERLALQARFERLASVVPGSIYEFQTLRDGREKLLYASPAFKEIFGVEPEEFAQDAAGFRAMVLSEDDADVRNLTATAADELRPINIEQRVLTPHRGLRWVTCIATPQREADGGTLWYGVFMDTTERRNVGERLRASQMQLRAALDAGGMGIISTNFDTGVIEMDATARRVWGLAAVTDPVLTFEHTQGMLHPRSPRSPREKLAQAAPNVELNTTEHCLLLPNGEERWVAVRGKTYRDESTGARMAAGVVMDITQQRRLNDQRLHSQKLEALGVLAGGIAHDFNNLLLAISGNARLLLTDLPQDDPARTSVSEIHKAALRAAELVRRILSFSSVHEPGQTGQSTVLGPVLDEVLGLARAVLPTTVVLNTKIAEGLPQILADSMQVHQTVINLLTNGADAVSATGGGTIRLEVAPVDVTGSIQQLTPEVKPGRYVCITVSDNGKGIDPGILPRVFDPFFTTKPSGRGTGLGLAIVHGIMKSIDGAVTVRSTPGSGATFALYFPAQYATAAVAQPVSESAPASRSAHILYVDDEEPLVFLMTRTLERMGHRVTACLSPEAALEKFKATPDEFDLVVSDMAMPELSGIELAERILAVRPNLPFIITSGFVDAAAVERAQAIGVRQTIMKPNTVEELSTALGAILREQAVTEGNGSSNA